MTKETKFLTYWRELNAHLAALGKRPADHGMARAAHRHLPPFEAARVIPCTGLTAPR